MRTKRRYQKDTMRPNPKPYYTTPEPETQIEKVAIYCRVSTEEQAKYGSSIRDQVQALRRYCEEHNYTIIGEYLDEGFSARKSYRYRPALQALLRDVESGIVKLILFTKLDRYFRNVGDYYKTQEILDRNGCQWQAILESLENRSSEGRFKVNLLLSLSEREASITSDRMRFTVQEKRKRGEYIGGTPPMGYRVTGGRLEKDPKQEAMVTAMFETFLETKSRDAAYQAAVERGYTHQKRAMLRALDKVTQSHTGTTNGVHVEPYLTMEQAKEIEQVLAYKGRLPREQFVFSGLVWCGTCGGRMSGHSNYTNRDRNRKYHLYNCTTHYNVKPVMCFNSSNYRELDLEEHLLTTIEPAFESFRSAASRSPRSMPAPDTDKLRRSVEQRKARLLDIYIDGTIGKEQYRGRLADLEAELAAIPVSPAPARIPAKLPPNWQEIYRSLTTSNKREFWRSIISKIIIHADRRVEVVFLP